MTRDEAIKELTELLPEEFLSEYSEALDMAIKALEQQPTDAVDRQAVLEAIDEDKRNVPFCCFATNNDAECFKQIIRELPPVTPQPKIGSSSENPNKWIPIKWHEITDEEREREGYPKEWAGHLDCIMPYDGQRILITTKGGFVELDECYSDDGCTFELDSGYDWVDDVVAWMPLPEPYKAESEDKE